MSLLKRFKNGLKSKLKTKFEREVANVVGRALAAHNPNYSSPNVSHAVANLHASTTYILEGDHIVAEYGKVVRRVQYWRNTHTNEIHITAQNYITAPEATREDLIFSKWNTGESYSGSVDPEYLYKLNDGYRFDRTKALIDNLTDSERALLKASRAAQFELVDGKAVRVEPKRVDSLRAYKENNPA